MKYFVYYIFLAAKRKTRKTFEKKKKFLYFLCHLAYSYLPSVLQYSSMHISGVSIKYPHTVKHLTGFNMGLGIARKIINLKLKMHSYSISKLRM